MKKLSLFLFAMLLPMVASAYDFEVDGYRYTVITSSTAEFAGVNPDYEGEVIIPEYVLFLGNQLSVNTIGERAFQNYESSFLRIPKHITLIKDAAFYEARIDSLHFEDCENSISLRNTINRGPSMSYSYLGSVYIGRQLNRTDWNSNANGPFYVSRVKNVYIGKTCSLVQELFQNCSFLENVIVKEGSFISSISNECFRDCSRLKHIDLNYGLTSISSLAFYGCTSLDSIYIPSTVTSISSNAFSEATNIKKVVSASDAPLSIGETAFPGIVYLSSTLFVPIGTKSKYETTDGWKEFMNIVETGDIIDNYYNANITVSDGGCVICNGVSITNGSTILSVKTNEDLNLQIIPNDIFCLKSLMVDGNDVTNMVADGLYTIKKIKSNVSIIATFEHHFDVSHIVNIINVIMNGNPTTSDIAIYDMNHDGVLNIGDVILIVRNILNYGGSLLSAPHNSTNVMTDLTRYTAAQFELKTGNANVKNIRLVKNMEQSHRLMYRQIDAETYAVVIYSQSNELLKPENDNIIVVETEGDSSGAMAIRNITVATPTGETTNYKGLQVATSIQQIESIESTAVIYDLKGHRLSGSRKGVNIINGKKTVVR